MELKKGDKVKFLNDIGGGVVTRIDGKIVHVRNEDGFEIPVQISQLLKKETQEKAYDLFDPDIQEVAEPSKEPVSQDPSPLEYIDISMDSGDSNIDTTINILLACTVNKNKENNDIYDLYLINDCGYHIMYVTAMITGGVYKGLQAGMLENNTTIHLAEIFGTDLKNIKSIHFDILFFKKGNYMPQDPMHYKLSIDEFYFIDKTHYSANGYLDEKAIVYNISEEYLLHEIENTASKHQAQLEKQKKEIDLPQKSPNIKNDPQKEIQEIDLHIEQLSDNYQHLSPGEILDIQMGRFDIALEGAIRNRQKRIVFIHGVGNGRLRLEIRKTLEQKYPKLRYQDASFKEYGYGATLVFL
ncbi:MAG: DUF2027 domain-containing protein [Bacteroidales bacterium]|jgi:hypothetical protein|nr:DUF2027 domain-containing protein [Bacteroidales bacterium]